MNKVHQIFIASYRRDFPYLIPCLRSIKKFVKGFATTVVAVPPPDVEELIGRLRDVGLQDDVAVAHQLGLPGDSGFYRAQCSMLAADGFCRQADYVYLVGSDCLFWREFNTSTMFAEDCVLPIMYASSMERLVKENNPTVHWREGTRLTTGIEPLHDYMRQLPIVYPRAVFAATRARITTHTELHWMKAVRKHFDHFSESNVLGAVAHTYMPYAYRWAIDTRMPLNPLLQFWSHGGVEWVCDRNQSYTYGDGSLTNNTFARRYEEVVRDVLGG